MTIPEWTERRIGSILSAPRMWGSLEAVEAQVITLCEVRQVALTGSPGGVLEAYRAHIEKYFPDDVPAPASSLAKSESEFVFVLREFVGRSSACAPTPQR